MIMIVFYDRNSQKRLPEHCEWQRKSRHVVTVQLAELLRYVNVAVDNIGVRDCRMERYR